MPRLDGIVDIEYQEECDKFQLTVGDSKNGFFVVSLKREKAERLFDTLRKGLYKGYSILAFEDC